MHYWDISLLRVSLDLPRMPILPCINFPPVLFPIVFSIPRNLSTFHGIIIFTIIQTSITGNNVNSSLNLWFRFFFPFLWDAGGKRSLFLVDRGFVFPSFVLLLLLLLLPTSTHFHPLPPNQLSPIRAGEQKRYPQAHDKITHQIHPILLPRLVCF